MTKLEYEREYYRRNREQINAQRRERFARHPERKREADRTYRQANAQRLLEKERERRYGLTPAAFDAMLKQQGGVCAVCRGPFGDGPKHRHVDHDHETGKVRGILCRDCNHALGNAHDSIERLEALISYLRSYR